MAPGVTTAAADPAIARKPRVVEQLFATVDGGRFCRRSQSNLGQHLQRSQPNQGNRIRESTGDPGPCSALVQGHRRRTQANRLATVVLDSVGAGHQLVNSGQQDHAEIIVGQGNGHRIAGSPVRNAHVIQPQSGFQLVRSGDDCGNRDCADHVQHHATPVDTATGRLGLCIEQLVRNQYVATVTGDGHPTDIVTQQVPQERPLTETRITKGQPATERGGDQPTTIGKLEQSPRGERQIEGSYPSNHSVGRPFNQCQPPRPQRRDHGTLPVGRRGHRDRVPGHRNSPRHLEPFPATDTDQLVPGFVGCQHPIPTRHSRQGRESLSDGRLGQDLMRVPVNNRHRTAASIGHQHLSARR